MKRTLSLLVLASWIAMVALLIRKQAPAPSRDVMGLPPAASGERDEWFGVYHDGEKVGHAHRVTASTADGYAFYEDSVLALAMLGVAQTLRTSLTAETDTSFALRRFRFTLISPATVFSATGTSDGERLAVTYGDQGERAQLSVPLTGPIYLPSTLRPRVLAGDLTSGTQYTVPVFSPLTLQSEPMTVTVEGRETVAGLNGPVETVRLAEEHQGVRARCWIGSDGAVLREEGALGFTLEREPAGRALAEAGARTPVDLTAASRIPLSGFIDDPRRAGHLVLRLRGAAAGSIPDDPPRQRVTADVVEITREAIPAAVPFPAAHGGMASLDAYTAAAPLIESDDPTVVAEARAIVGAAADATSAAQRLVAWVAAHVDKTPSVTVPSARAVLAARRGDCNEHAVLLTALARAAGIPARVVAGAVYAQDGFYYHAWTELWLGRWVSADSVFDQMPADATHVKLIEGGPEQHIALAGLIGKLELTLEEAR
jgi:hypothetical protein